MRIVIDLQGAQTESRFRGIGRYSLSLTKAIIRNRGDHEVLIALNGMFPETIEPIRADFDGLLPQENIRVWYAPGPVRECHAENIWRHQAAELIREAFISGLRPDVVHITSLFDGYMDDAVTSIGCFDQSLLVSVTLYDLIPMMNPEKYLTVNPPYERFYRRKIEHFRHSSLVLAISESSRSEGIEILGLDPLSVVNISTAGDAHFQPMTLSEAEENYLRNKFELTRTVVLYTGGADERKNLPHLLNAYAQLSSELRKTHQLVFAGKLDERTVHRLKREAKSAGLRSDELILTGYVSEDELVQLYNLCELYVFPSWHEGFGLPALEAMLCGTPVVAANTSSLPEVIGWQDALFDPYSVAAIRAKIEQGLTDESFRADLIRHGLEQAKKFTWDKTGQRAIAAFEHCFAERTPLRIGESVHACRPKLAYVSPLPPERTGIADYSAELLPELSRHYDIDVIVTQDAVSDDWIKGNCKVRDVAWFKIHSKHYDRILYHFGNSPFHQHMFALLEEIPGTVVMHDFFLSGIQAYREESGLAPGVWTSELYHAHGYNAVWERYHSQDLTTIKIKYPVNLSVLQNAQGVIMHSEVTRRMAKEWYGLYETEDWALIPLLRVPVFESDRAEARRLLNLGAEDFIVCSFGFLDPAKLSHSLLDAWLSSNLAGNEKCELIFVGENHGGDYGQELLDTIHRSEFADNIRISGWVEMASFRQYLAAADVAVQLRTHSRGETSAAVLDCMNYGLSTIVNANGSMQDLPDDGVWKLPDEFNEQQMVAALETLWRDAPLRQKLGARAREIIVTRHAPDACANQYFEAIERFYNQTQTSASSLIKSVAALDSHQPNDAECLALAQSIAQNMPVQAPNKQFLLDVSATSRTDLKTGIERVARSLLLELIINPPEGYRIEPVYLSDIGGRWHYRYARGYTLGMLGCPNNIIADERIETHPGDIVLGLDLFGEGLVEAQGYLDELHRDGVSIHFVVFDLLPVLLPQTFPPGAEESHAHWLRVISRYDGAICISKAVADELTVWIKHKGLVKSPPLKISWFHLGADIESSSPSRGVTDDASSVIKKIQKDTSFLMVGTIEPRKGYDLVLSAFEQLWAEGIDVRLVIVGKEGWRELSSELRRTIPETVKHLRTHSELGERLIWLEGISDEYLERIYAASKCLIAASEGEGFGLPLIEAAQHKLPIILREIPVFREVAGENAFYFDGTESTALATAIQNWLNLYMSKQHPESHSMPWLTWKQSAENLLSVLMENEKII